jgi:formate hydrogenlyase subunit 3/multisubunit Na+/H+ antiporter MnhD subunit
MIPGPLLLLGLLLFAAIAVYFLRRFEPVAALVASGLSVLIAVGLWRMPLNAPTVVLGRPISMGQVLTWEDISLHISPASRALLVFLFAMAAVAFILAWRTFQGRSFYPFGLILLALWSAVVELQPLTLAPLAVVLAAVLSVFLIQAGRPGETHGAWRQLMFPALAVPFFLVAAWFIEQAPLNPDDQTPLRIAGTLLIAGFVLLIQPAPLHVAVPAVAGQAPPVVAAFLWTGGQAITLFLLQRFLVTYPWLSDAIDSARWLLWLGVLTAVLGGVVAATQRRLGRMAGYAALYDYGVLIVALGLRGTAGLPTAIWLLVTRTFSLFTLAAGAAGIRHYMTSDAYDRIHGAASRLPWAVIALIAGGFGLAGLPLTAQFASRWALLQLVTENDPRWTLLLIAGAIGVIIGVVRAGQACFGELRASPVEREPVGLALVAIVLVVAGLVLGLFPQLLTGPVAAVILPLSVLEP